MDEVTILGDPIFNYTTPNHKANPHKRLLLPHTGAVFLCPPPPDTWPLTPAT